MGTRLRKNEAKRDLELIKPHPCVRDWEAWVTIGHEKRWPDTEGLLPGEQPHEIGLFSRVPFKR